LLVPRGRVILWHVPEMIYMRQNMTAKPFRLPQLRLLSGLSDKELDVVRSHATRRDIQAGQIIMLEGDKCTKVCFVAQGLVRLRQLSLEGREHVLAYVGPGSCLNLVPSLDGGTILATADAIADTTLYAVCCKEFEKLLGESRGLSRAVALQLAEETRRLSGMVRDLALYGVRARLARFLLQNAEDEPSQQRWTQAAIAANIGTVRDVVGRVLRSFAEEGLVQRERGRLRVLDRERLEVIAHEG